MIIGSVKPFYDPVILNVFFVGTTVVCGLYNIAYIL